MNASSMFISPAALRGPKPNSTYAIAASAGSCRPDINRPLLARADDVIE
jgi:hypothetical protein